MLNKRIKSLLVAGLVILGMGFAKVDSYAAETTNSITEFNFVDIDNGGPLASIHTFEDENITITIRSVGGYSEHPEGTYEISANWNTSMIDMKSINVVTMQNAIEESKETTSLVLEDGQAFLRIKINIEQAIDVINLEYELADNSSGEEELTIEEQIIKNYIDQMNSTNIGARNEATKTRIIGKEYAISKDDWDAHIEQIEALGGLKVVSAIGNNQYSGQYEIRSVFSNELIEIIEIEFFNATESKGWIPEITPGTGQALAIGGIAIGAAAAVGLLVNNRRRKDEE